MTGMSYAQQCILKKITQKIDRLSFGDWTEYE